ncbi:MAG TPA: UDP-N-acetylmuramoyl-L-alanyl-D-glutamate--2,6-diaminopimelate ligase [Gaiellales bacterium]
MELATLCAESGASLQPLALLDGVDVVDLSLRLDAVSDGTFFACVPGTSVDGHELAGEAAARGATALLVERPLEVALPQVRAARVRDALGPLAHVISGRPSEHLTVVGVTGTNGKTTTAFLVSAMLDAAGRRSGLLGTVEARVGGVPERLALTTPEAPDLHRLLARMRDAGDAACVLEASSIAVSMGRLDGLRLAAIGFTNLSQDHLDFHGSMEAYLAAKASLFDGRCLRAANADDPAGRTLPAELRYGVDAPADVHARRVRLEAAGTRLEIDTPRGLLELDSPLRGRFNVENLLCAISLALLVDLPDEAIVAGAHAVGAPPGRFEPVDAGQPFSVIVDYAHTPTGIEAVLRSARAAASGRVLCVFGAGGDRDRVKRPLMAAAAESGADRVYVTSDNPRSEDPLAILAEIVDGLGRPEAAVVEPDRRAAIARAFADASAGDVVVICGKGHEQGQEIAGVVHPFDDRIVARELLGAAS